MNLCEIHTDVISIISLYLKPKEVYYLLLLCKSIKINNYAKEETMALINLINKTPINIQAEWLDSEENMPIWVYKALLKFEDSIPLTHRFSEPIYRFQICVNLKFSFGYQCKEVGTLFEKANDFPEQKLLVWFINSTHVTIIFKKKWYLEDVKHTIDIIHDLCRSCPLRRSNRIKTHYV